MALRFYNTLTQEVQPFAPLHDNEVRMYTCGPRFTISSTSATYAHFRFQDVLRRWLRARGYKLNHVMNITDVEDKIIRNAEAEGKTSTSTPRYTRKRFSRIRPNCAWSAPSESSKPPSKSMPWCRTSKN